MSQQYTFPAIFYKDKENDSYTVAFADLDVFTEGETIEEAYESAKEFLRAYIKYSIKEYGEVELASSYDDVKKEHQNETVMLVNVNI